MGWFGTHLGWWLTEQLAEPLHDRTQQLPAHHGVSPVSGRPVHLLVQLVEEGVDAFLVDAVNNKGESVCDTLAPFLVAERRDHAASTVGDGLEDVVGHCIDGHVALAILDVLAEAHRRATRLAEALDVGAGMRP